MDENENDANRTRPLFRIDMVGTWTGIYGGESVEYVQRVILEEGQGGETLWRGTEEDRPFYYYPSQEVHIDVLLDKHPAERSSLYLLGYGEEKENTILEDVSQMTHWTPLRLIESGQMGRPAGLVGDEIPVSGIVQWKISENEDNQEFIDTYNNVFGSSDLERKKALEFVSGCYSPSSGRLVYRGTHKSCGGEKVIGCDLYDLNLSDDKLSMEGRSADQDCFATATVSLTSVTGQGSINIEGIEFSSLKERDLKQTLAYRKAAEALEKIHNPTIQEDVTLEQAKLFKTICEDDCMEESNIHLGTLKRIADEQSRRLQGLLLDCMKKYSILEERFKFLRSIPDRKCPSQKLTSTHCVGPVLDFRVQALLAMAERQEAPFRQKIKGVVRSVNALSARDTHGDPDGVEDDALGFFCEKYQLVKENWPIDPLKGGLQEGEKDSDSILVSGQFGPIKSFDRALAKLRAGKSLKDLNRVTLLFEDPYVMALTFAAIDSKYSVLGVKNKLIEDINGDIEFQQPPVLHLNVDMDGSGWLVEIQMMFVDILTIKKELHHFYDITRAESPICLLSPLYKVSHGSSSVLE